MKKLCILALMCVLLSVSCFAEDTLGLGEAQAAVPDSVRDVTGGIDDGVYDAQGALSRLFELARTELKGSFSANLRSAAAIVAVIMLTSIAVSLSEGARAGECVSLVSVCTLCAVLAGGMDSLMVQATDTINSLVSYSIISLPVLFTAAACTAPTGAAAGYAAACFGIDMLMELSSRVILPLIYAYTATVCASSVFDNTVLGGIMKLIKTAAVTLMSAVCIIFTAYISITGIITGSVDAAAAKAVKTGISTVLPVVGGIISDASSAVIAAAGTVRASIGALGLVCVCAICISPFASIGTQIIIFKACGAMAQSFPCGRAGKLLDGLGTALTLQLGLLGSFGVMIFISIMAGLKVVGL